MNLINRVCDLLDFPHHEVSTAIHEAASKEKLQNTWMRVNGKVMYVGKFLWDTNEIVNKDKKKILVTDLDVFLPETGLYSDGFSCCYVKKLPKKQWAKSFSYNNYGCLYLYMNGTMNDDDYTDFVGRAQKVPFFLTPDGRLFFAKYTVAKVQDNICEVSNPLFHQEVLDFVQKEKLPWMVQ